MPLFFSIPREVVEKLTPECIPFKFVDLFADIGGFRIALEKLGGECAFSCGWDKYYLRNIEGTCFGDMHIETTH